MALYTIADLHLACSVNKPMDIFGGKWQNYMEKIRTHWNAVVKPEDTVVIGGDLSWGINFAQSKADFDYLHALPGKKILLKGNHDLWWNTVKKMTEFAAQNGYDDVSFLHNNCYFYEDVALCGTRGWFFEEDFQESHDEKIFRRELMRLETSLKAGRDGGAKELYCFLHYPPIYANFRCGEIIDLMKKYGVTRCIYGHLHSDSLRWAVTGPHEGIDFILVSGDYLDFTPVLLKK